jgi:hypothetical protein
MQGYSDDEKRRAGRGRSLAAHLAGLLAGSEERTGTGPDYSLLGAPPAFAADPSSLLELKPSADGRLPSRGAHYSEGIRLVPSRDYRGESVLELNSDGNGGLKVNLAPADVAALRNAVAVPAITASVREELDALLDEAGQLARQGVPEEHGKGSSNLAAAFMDLVGAAHAAGYRAAQTRRGAALRLRWYLEGKRQEHAAETEAENDGLVEAIDRVLLLLVTEA